MALRILCRFAHAPMKQQANQARVNSFLGAMYSKYRFSTNVSEQDFIFRQVSNDVGSGHVMISLIFSVSVDFCINRQISYGNYADAAFLSAERQGPWASCFSIVKGYVWNNITNLQANKIYTNVIQSYSNCKKCPIFKCPV